MIYKKSKKLEGCVGHKAIQVMLWKLYKSGHEGYAS